MHYPEFYEKVKSFKLYDPLSDFLGALEDGIVEINYLDCVKLAGHSCPTVAGSYILAQEGLKALYGENEIPSRSEIEVAMHAEKTNGVTGVIGSVIAYICGAGDEGGFAGIGGKFSRKGRLSYANSDVAGDVRIKRLDSGAWVSLKLDTSVVGGSPEMMPLMQKALQGLANSEEQKRFADLWQGRVEAMLTLPEKWGSIAPVVEHS